jgi:Ca2+-binding RTX toxin-like protein
VLKGGGGDDRLEGGNGHDILQSDGFGSSILDGGAGDDTFRGTNSRDLVIGGAGSDTLDFSHTGGVTISLGDPIPYWAGLEDPHAQFSSIENLTGSNGQDILVGDGGTNVLRGGGEKDNLIGGRARTSCMAAPITTPTMSTLPAILSGNTPAKA